MFKFFGLARVRRLAREIASLYSTNHAQKHGSQHQKNF
jgi:hypothetical protein